MHLLATLLQSFAIAAAQPAEPPIEYNRDIRPILSENCFRCHGPDARQRKAGLRLDVEADAKRELDSGDRAIVPGDSKTSALVARIETNDPAERMPPPESGKTLTPRDVELLKKWIEAGAVWQGHWSHQPIRRPAPPPADDPAFVKTRSTNSDQAEGPASVFRSAAAWSLAAISSVTADSPRAIRPGSTLPLIWGSGFSKCAIWNLVESAHE